MSRPKVAPYLTVSPAAGAIGFYTAVFGARQKALMPSVDGLRVMHCELEINGGAVMLSDAFLELGQTRPPMPGEPATMSVALEYASAEEVDAIIEKARSFGARLEMGPMASFWGTRYASFRDPFGHRWILNAPLEKAPAPTFDPFEFFKAALAPLTPKPEPQAKPGEPAETPPEKTKGD